MASTPTPKLAAALLVAQRNAGSVTKAGENKQQRLMYARGEDMIAAGRAALNGAGLTLSMLASSVDGLQILGEHNAIATLSTTWLLEHAETGESREVRWAMPAVAHKGMPIDKAVAAADTYGLAYLIRDLLQIDRRLEGEVSPDERDEDRASQGWDPRREAEQRDRQATAPMSAVPPPPAAAAPTQKDDRGFVLAAGFIHELSMAANADEVKSIGQRAAARELGADDVRAVKVAAQKRLIDFCRTQTEFAARAARVQELFRQDAAALEEVKAYYDAAKTRSQATDSNGGFQ